MRRLAKYRKKKGNLKGTYFEPKDIGDGWEVLICSKHVVWKKYLTTSISMDIRKMNNTTEYELYFCGIRLFEKVTSLPGAKLLLGSLAKTELQMAMNVLNEGENGDINKEG